MTIIFVIPSREDVTIFIRGKLVLYADKHVLRNDSTSMNHSPPLSRHQLIRCRRWAWAKQEAFRWRKDTRRRWISSAPVSARPLRCTIRRRPPSASVLRPRALSFARTKPDCHRTTPGLLHMYYMRLCSEKLLSDIRARTLFVLLPRPRRLPSPCRQLPPALPFPLQGTLHRGVTLHLAPVSRVVGSYSRRFERTHGGDIGLSLASLSSTLSCPDLPFYSLDAPFSGGKERSTTTTTARVDRPSSSMIADFSIR